MRRLTHLSIPFTLIVLVILAQQASAWGAAGHAIVATIAQSLLHPSIRSHLCTILPSFTSYSSPYPLKGAPHTHCHLATLASWPDTAKWRMPWSGHLHYVNPLHDDPPSSCAYGEYGWTSEENVLTAMVNYTRQLKESKGGFERDAALRFVTHLVGDAHQPLHLTGRARGGNDVMVRFEGRQARLHSVWDSQIINVHMRNLANYTTPLPSLRIESALQGRAYDAYTRWILNEGLGGWWADEWESWSSCPDDDHVEQQATSGGPTNDVDETDLPLCPMAWTKPMHPLVCKYAFASPVPAPSGAEEAEQLGMHNGEYDDSAFPVSWGETKRRRRRGRRGSGRRPGSPGNPSTPPPDHPQLPELADEYLERINADKVIQKQLAKAGVRLAAILNTLLLEEAQAAEAQQASWIGGKTESWLFTLGASLWQPLRQRLAVWGF